MRYLLILWRALADFIRVLFSSVVRIASNRDAANSNMFAMSARVKLTPVSAIAATVSALKGGVDMVNVL